MKQKNQLSKSIAGQPNSYDVINRPADERGPYTSLFLHLSFHRSFIDFGTRSSITAVDEALEQRIGNAWMPIRLIIQILSDEHMESESKTEAIIAIEERHKITYLGFSWVPLSALQNQIAVPATFTANGNRHAVQGFALFAARVSITNPEKQKQI